MMNHNHIAWSIQSIHHTDADFDTVSTEAKFGGKFTQDPSVGATALTPTARLRAIQELWPFMVPLFAVYFAEYAMQAGVWAAIGFPITSQSARDDFYLWSNWVYQAGVLVSRSSGTVCAEYVGMYTLWFMPLLQVVLLLFFLLDGYYQFWYNYGLLSLCFVVGLLGGGVYVHGFSLLAESVPPFLKEFSLSAASVADSFGIALAVVCSIFIQESLYDYHNISDDS